MVIATTGAFGESNFYTQVNSMWFAGDKQGVLAIAEQRLARNSNDLAGLLLKAEYEVAFLQLDQWPCTFARAIEVGTQYSGTNFAKRLPLMKLVLQMGMEIVTNYPPEEFEADKAKALLPGKTMTCGAEIQALQNDGYFEGKPQQPLSPR